MLYSCGLKKLVTYRKVNLDFGREGQFLWHSRWPKVTGLTQSQKNEIIGIMAFDLSAAFDTICHSTLLAKLETAGVTGIPLQWFQSYLSNRSQNVLWNGILSKPLPLNRGVPQGSILGPILFLAMIYDMPKFLTRETLVTSSKVMGYADDTTVYIKARNIEHLISEMEWLGSKMVSYCHKNGLILNAQKTQILTTEKKKIEIIIGQDTVLSSQTISLLGLEYDTNLSTAPYLRRLAREANTRAALIRRLSFGMPNYLLKPLTNHTVQIMVLNRKSNMAQFRLHFLHCLYVYNSLLKGF